LFNFFIVLLLAAVAGFGTAAKEGMSDLQILSGILLLAISLIFKLLDQRTSLLIKDAEGALQCLEEIMAKEFGPKFRLVELSEMKRGTTSYRAAFSVVYIGAFVIGLFFMVVGSVNYFGSAAQV